MTIIEALQEIKDPRQHGKISYSLVNILFISICAIFNSAETWEDIAMYAKYREEWLSKYIDMSEGIPSSYTFRRVFGLISPNEISQLTHDIISKFFTSQYSGQFYSIIDFSYKLFYNFLNFICTCHYQNLSTIYLTYQSLQKHS